MYQKGANKSCMYWVGLLRESLGVWWPCLMIDICSCPALLTPSVGVGSKGSPSIAWGKEKKEVEI